MTMPNLTLSPLAMTLSLTFSAAALAQTPPVKQLDTIVVTASKANVVSPIYIGESTISMTPNASESVTGLLRPLSSVQFSDEAQQSGKAELLAPPLVSIRGTRPFESSYLINGFSNNNILSPGQYSDRGFGILPTNGPEVIWLDPDMVDEVVVHSENISAQYGGFLGGVVNAELKTPNRKKWTGSVRGSYTDNHLTEQFFTGSDTGLVDRERFSRYQAGFSLEGPIQEDVLSARIGVDLLRSTAPVYTNLLEGVKFKNQNRINTLLALSAKVSEVWTSDLTMMYSPVVNHNYAPGQWHGKFTSKMGGMNVLWRQKIETNVGKVTLDTGWMRQQLETDGSSDTAYQWLAKPGGKPSRYATWSDGARANEGLLGDVSQKVDSYTLKAGLDAKAFDWLGMTHSVKTGGEVVMHRAHAQDSAFESFARPMASTKVLGSLSDGVVEKEQYAALKSVRHPRDVRRHVNQWALYLEDTIDFKRLEVRPGVRVSYDSVVKKVNIAPRFKASVDVLGTGSFKVMGGWNRYYGNQLMGLALRGLNPLERFTRKLNPDGTLSPWKAAPMMAGNLNDFGKLKTPHSDEWVLGTEAQIPYVGRLALTGVVRHHKDQLTTSFDRATRVMTYSNEGKSRYQGLTLDWQRSLDLDKAGKHDLKLGVTWSQTKGNILASRDFTNSEMPEALEPWVVLDGEIIDRANLPAGTFNSPWVVTFSDSMRWWDDRLKAMLTLRYQKGGKYVAKQTRGTVIDGVRYDTYTTQKSRAHLYVDAQFEGVLYKAGDQSLALQVDVFNLLNRRNKTGDSRSFGLGRQTVLSGIYRF